MSSYKSFRDPNGGANLLWTWRQNVGQPPTAVPTKTQRAAMAACVAYQNNQAAQKLLLPSRREMACVSHVAPTLLSKKAALYANNPWKHAASSTDTKAQQWSLLARAAAAGNTGSASAAVMARLTEGCN